MTALRKLLKYPHAAVFDTKPHEQVAFRIKHPVQCSWTIADEVMTVSNDVEAFSYELSALTVAQLAQALEVDGFEVDVVSSDFATLSAAVLVEGSGEQTKSKNVPAFTNLIYGLFGGYARELREAKKQVGEAIKQMVISNSEGEWLDLWGYLYDHTRRQGQTDESYALEIPREAFRVRVNALAIEQAILDLTGKDVRIEEPFRGMFRLSESRLSGQDKFYNGDQVGPFLIRPVTNDPIDWDDVLPVIRRNKSAGVVILEPEIRPAYLWQAQALGDVYMASTAIFAQLIRSVSEGRLSYMRLSNEQYIRNYTTSVSVVKTSYIEANSPVSISMQIYAFSGPTWLYAKVWGPFAWDSDLTEQTVSVQTSFGIGTMEFEEWK